MRHFAAVLNIKDSALWLANAKCWKAFKEPAGPLLVSAARCEIERYKKLDVSFALFIVDNVFKM